MNDTQSAPNGEVFAIGDLLDLIVPFEFEFEGRKLKGRWYKFKTSTRAYVKGKTADRLAVLERWTAMQQEMRSLLPDDPRTEEVKEQSLQLEEEADRAQTSWLVDAIVEWNAVGRDGATIPITAAGFADIPIPFLTVLADYLVESRTDKNPTLTDS